MLELIGMADWTAKSAAVVFGLLIGTAFGILAQRSRFCLRSALIASPNGGNSAAGVWAAALAIATLATTALISLGLIDFSAHRFHSSHVAMAAILLGGLMFGVGMVLTRGCISRLTVLTGTGNLRALVVLAIVAITAHATLKGALAPIRTWIASFGWEVEGAAALSVLPGGLWLATLLILVAAAVVISRAGARYVDLAAGASIGALTAAAWYVTSVLLADDFDPIPQESVSFTSAASETLFWWIAATAIAPTFGVGLFVGTFVGSLVAALATREFTVVGFTSENHLGHYLAGGALMGIGGALAGGCSVGAGLAGISTLSVSAILTLASIIAGGWLANTVLRGKSGRRSVGPRSWPQAGTRAHN